MKLMTINVVDLFIILKKFIWTKIIKHIKFLLIIDLKIVYDRLLI